MQQACTTTAAVIEALDGVSAVAHLTGVKYGVAWNWKVSETFPAKTFLVMTTALQARGYTAPPELWNQTAPTDAVAG